MTDWVELDLPDAGLRLAPQWLIPAEADRLLDLLRLEVPWERHRIRIYGREVDSPRLSCWIGDSGLAYRYSGTRFEPHPWFPALQSLRARLREEIRVPFNSVLANLYRDGADSMGWHADDEPELGPDPVIASLSLGAARRFSLKHRNDPTARLAATLPHGSLLLMGKGVQKHYRHAVPKTARPVGERINLTFRRILR
ncbi:MAG: alpha-ketoglutarate-dependent dioxygenase AlkB [Xanthomonadaceae bacterium]|nr:alpha-ketoglutarate-dependent dioxygenase AlkB [Xanthomonadaceae bacterium]